MFHLYLLRFEKSAIHAEKLPHRTHPVSINLRVEAQSQGWNPWVASLHNLSVHKGLGTQAEPPWDLSWVYSLVALISCYRMHLDNDSMIHEHYDIVANVMPQHRSRGVRNSVTRSLLCKRWFLSARIRKIQNFKPIIIIYWCVNILIRMYNITIERFIEYVCNFVYKLCDVLYMIDVHNISQEKPIKTGTAAQCN